MRRSGPRPLSAALERLGHETAPTTLLARVQAAWAPVAGAAIAAEAQPVSERDGTVTIVCRSAGWASELELLGPDLVERLNEALAGAGAAPLSGLRAKVGQLP